MEPTRKLAGYKISLRLALIDLKNAYFLTSIGKNDVYVLGKVSRFIESSMPLTMVFETCSFNCHYVLMY